MNYDIPGRRPVFIRPPRSLFEQPLAELLEFRDLLFLLAWRDVALRYKQTLLGLGWAVGQPLLSVAVFSLFFGRLAGLPSDGVPYPLFAFVGLMGWQYFSQVLIAIANSLVASAGLLTKAYFPRILVPLAQLFPPALDFLVTLLLLPILGAFYGAVPGVRALWVPAFLLLAALGALGPGLWLATFNVRFRDVRYAIPFAVQLWMFATPVAYPASLAPERWRALLGLNPAAGAIEGLRWSLLGTSALPVELLLVSAGSALALLLSGLAVFFHGERTFADEV